MKESTLEGSHYRIHTSQRWRNTHGKYSSDWSARVDQVSDNCWFRMENSVNKFRSRNGNETTWTIAPWFRSQCQTWPSFLSQECMTCALSHNAIYDYDNSRRLWRSKIATARINSLRVLNASRKIVKRRMYNRLKSNVARKGGTTLCRSVKSSSLYKCTKFRP